jgi:hypothetical protein
VSEANTEAGIAVKIITEQHAAAVLAVFLIFILSVPPLVLKKPRGAVYRTIHINIKMPIHYIKLSLSTDKLYRMESVVSSINIWWMWLIKEGNYEQYGNNGKSLKGEHNIKHSAYRI